MSKNEIIDKILELKMKKNKLKRINYKFKNYNNN